MNAVGVEVNTASPALLSRVAGVGPVLSENIVAYRNEHGPFTKRSELKKVPRLGAKAFEQCAGFLRITGERSRWMPPACTPRPTPWRGKSRRPPGMLRPREAMRR